jgi:hypothetical protein
MKIFILSCAMHIQSKNTIPATTQCYKTLTNSALLTTGLITVRKENAVIIAYT